MRKSVLFPSAAMACAAMVCSAAPLRAEQFDYTSHPAGGDADGKLVKVGKGWDEYGSGRKIASFSELARTDKVVLLFDASRLMVLRLPLTGGEAFWTDLSGDGWSKLADVNHEP